MDGYFQVATIGVGGKVEPFAMMNSIVVGSEAADVSALCSGGHNGSSRSEAEAGSAVGVGVYNHRISTLCNNYFH